nr:MAG TPA: hypothetical protein [Caudoviricetes sp.]
MRCRFARFRHGSHVKCSKIDSYCLYQYWCTTERTYKCTGTKDNCKYYEETEPQDTAEKTKTE